jgi:cation diffusion facilitator family transporter
LSHKKTAIQTSWWSIISNLILAVAKGTVGFLGNSFALIADAVESTTDVFASTIVMLGLRYSSRPADENHPYGHGRAESLMTFIVTGFLLVSATVIALQGIQNLFKPQQMPEPYTLIVLGVIIVVKEALFRFVNKRSDTTNSTSLKADAWHHRSDAITSLVAFVGIALALLLGDGYEKLDDIAAIAAAGFIYYNAYLIFRPALGEVMDENNYEELIEKIRTIAIGVPGIKGTEKCFVRKLGMDYIVDLHALVDGNLSVTEGHQYAHILKDAIRKSQPEIIEVFIHIEPA